MLQNNFQLHVFNELILSILHHTFRFLVPNFFENDARKRFTYKRIPIYDNSSTDITTVMKECIDFIRRSRHHGGVLVHCNKGVSRSVSVVIAYLMKIEEMSLDDAYKLVHSKRDVAKPNDAFMKQLAILEKKYITERVVSWC